MIWKSVTGVWTGGTPFSDNGDFGDLPGVNKGKGLGGNDHIRGNDNTNVIFGNAGRDFLRGDGGDDSLHGGRDDDILLGDEAGDPLPGDDLLAGASGDDLLAGSGGDDSLHGGVGDDIGIGGTGDDLLRGHGGKDVMLGGSGHDRIKGGKGADLLLGQTGDDVLRGQAGEDGLSGGRGDDTLYGNAGDDLLAGNAGHDYINGGAGNDYAEGGSGHDVLRGWTGADTLIGGADDDVLLGQRGNDVLIGDSLDSAGLHGGGDDMIKGGGGDDTILGGDGDDVIEGNDNADCIDGGEGDDVIFGDNRDGQPATGHAADLINGGAGADTIRAGEDNDQVLGGSGNDVIHGGTGADTMDGEAGDDVIRGGEGNDQIRGGSGQDTLLGGKGDDAIAGGADGDTIHAGQGDDCADGGTGDDSIAGGAGDDTLIGGAGADHLEGKSGADRLSGGTGNDTLLGGGGSDSLIGNLGDDVLNGGKGSDRVFGDAGDDTLKGGGGGDDFIFGYGLDTDGDGICDETVTAVGHDEIIDFDADQNDRIVIHSAVAGAAGENLTAAIDGDDVVVTIASTNETIRVRGLVSELESIDPDDPFFDETTLIDSLLKTGEDGDGKGVIEIADTCVASVDCTVDQPQVAWTVQVQRPGATTVPLDGTPVGDTTIQTNQAQILSLFLESDANAIDEGPALGVDLFASTPPTVTATQPDEITEEADASAQTLTDSGTISFDDIDETDTVSISFAATGAPVWSGGAIDPGLAATLLDGFSVAGVIDAMPPGSTAWSYNATADLDALAAGETVSFGFTITATDSQGASATDQVVFTITGTNDAPTLAAGVAAADEDGPTVDVDLSALGDDMDSDDDGTTLSYAVTGDPSEGSASITGTTLTFDPGSDFQDLAEGETRQVTVEVTATDSHGATAVNDITVTITGTNDAPVAIADTNAGDPLVEAGSLVAGDNTAAGDVLINDSDPDASDVLAVQGVAAGDQTAGPALSGGTGSAVTGVYGSLVLNADGSWTYTLDDSDPDTDALSAGETVQEVFTYTVTDGNGGTDSTTLTLSIEGSDDNTAPAAADDSYSVHSGEVLTVAPATGLLANDTDADGDTLNVQSIEAPANGVINIATDGSFEYTPDPGFVGQEVLTYTISDGIETATAEVTIDVTNAAPVANADGITLTEDMPATLDVLANDTDQNPGQTLSVARINGTAVGAGDMVTLAHGVLTVNGDGTLGYAPDADYSGGDNFTYTASDGLADSDPATVTLTIEAVADTPVLSLTPPGGGGGDLTPQPLGTDVQVNTTTVDPQRWSAVTALKDGGYVIAWSSWGQDGDSWGIYAQRYAADGTAVGGEVQVNTTILFNQLSPNVTALADGGYVITWQSSGQDGSGYGIYAQRYAADGTQVGGEVQVNTTTANHQDQSEVATLADGGFLVTWTSWDQDGSGHGIYAQRYAADGSALGTEVQVNTTTADDQNYPDVTVLAGGGWVITWTSEGQDGSGYGIYAQRYAADGTPVGGEVQVNTTTGGDQNYSKVTALADGGWVVTWSSLGQDGSSWGIYAQRYAADGTALGGEVQVNTTTASAQRYSDVTALADGGWVVTWSSVFQDGDGWGIYAQRYAADGTALGDEYRVNDVTAGSQYYNSHSDMTATLTDGRVVTVWDQDFSEVFHRITEIPAAADGLEDQPLAIGLDAALTDTDGSETLSIRLSGFPAGATFNLGAADGADWVIAGAEALDLSTLTMTPPPDWNGTFTLTATATATEGANGDMASTTVAEDYTIAAAPDAPTLAVSDAAVAEDGSVFVPVNATLTGTGEALTLEVSGVAPGWDLTGAGWQQVAPGTFRLELPANTDYADGFTLAPPRDSDVDLTGLAVSATATSLITGASTTGSDTLDVTVDAVADAPFLIDGTAFAGELLTVPLHIPASLTDLDGSESFTGFTIADVPLDASFNMGTDLGGGVWAFTPAQIDGLEITFASLDTPVDLQVTAHVGETATSGVETTPGNNTASTTATLTVSGGADLTGSNGNDIFFYQWSPSTQTLTAVNQYTGQTVDIDPPLNVNNTTYEGLAGDDIIFMSNLADFLGPDSARVEIFIAGDGADVVNLSSYNDEAATTQGGGVTIDVGDDNDIIWSGSGSDLLFGQGGDDTIDGGPGDDLIWGGSSSGQNSGADDLSGGAGADLLNGEDGDDTFRFFPDGTWHGASVINPETGEAIDLSGRVQSHDVFVGGAGFDTVVMTDRSDALLLNDTVNPVHPDGDSLRLIEIERIEAGAGEDVIFLHDDLPTQHVYGSVIVDGGAGDDIVVTSAGNDELLGGTGDDRLYGGSGNDTLEGGDGSDLLMGGEGTDSLDGGDGNDVLDGGAGIDTLTGGSGADTFVFANPTAFTGADRITDLDLAEGDMLDLSDLLTAYDPLTHAIEDFVRITDNGTDSVIAVDTDGGGDSFVQVGLALDITGLSDEQWLLDNGWLIV